MKYRLFVQIKLKNILGFMFMISYMFGGFHLNYLPHCIRAHYSLNPGLYVGTYIIYSYYLL